MEEQKSVPYFFNVSLKLIVENEKGEILGLECKKEGNLSGFYDLPGGRINSDELRLPYEEIIAREIEEELGKDIQYKILLQPTSVGRYVYFSGKLGRENCIFMIFFKAEYLGGDIIISEEHIGYKWLNLNSENISEYFTSGFAEGINTYLQEKTKL